MAQHVAQGSRAQRGVVRLCPAAHWTCPNRVAIFLAATLPAAQHQLPALLQRWALYCLLAACTAVMACTQACIKAAPPAAHQLPCPAAPPSWLAECGTFLWARDPQVGSTTGWPALPSPHCTAVMCWHGLHSRLSAQPCHVLSHPPLAHPIRSYPAADNALQWEQSFYPFASAIDTLLPAVPPEAGSVHIMLGSKAAWVEPQVGPGWRCGAGGCWLGFFI